MTIITVAASFGTRTCRTGSAMATTRAARPAPRRRPGRGGATRVGRGDLGQEGEVGEADGGVAAPALEPDVEAGQGQRPPAAGRGARGRGSSSPAPPGHDEADDVEEPVTVGGEHEVGGAGGPHRAGRARPGGRRRPRRSGPAPWGWRSGPRGAGRSRGRPASAGRRTGGSLSRGSRTSTTTTSWRRARARSSRGQSLSSMRSVMRTTRPRRLAVSRMRRSASARLVDGPSAGPAPLLEPVEQRQRRRPARCGAGRRPPPGRRATPPPGCRPGR